MTNPTRAQANRDLMLLSEQIRAKHDVNPVAARLLAERQRPDLAQIAGPTDPRSTTGEWVQGPPIVGGVPASEIKPSAHVQLLQRAAELRQVKLDLSPEMAYAEVAQADPILFAEAISPQGKREALQFAEAKAPKTGDKREALEMAERVRFGESATAAQAATRQLEDLARELRSRHPGLYRTEALAFAEASRLRPDLLDQAVDKRGTTATLRATFAESERRG